MLVTISYTEQKSLKQLLKLSVANIGLSHGNLLHFHTAAKHLSPYWQYQVSFEAWRKEEEVVDNIEIGNNEKDEITSKEIGKR